MNKNKLSLKLSADKKEQIITEVKTLLKEKRSLKQSLQEEKEKSQSSKEELFLELLELFDSLEQLLLYMENNTELNTKFIQRLPKSLSAIQKKLLTILERRKVTLIHFEDTKPDYSICQVVDREIRDDIEEQTITKVVRQGFKINDNTLRPIEVITSKKIDINKIKK